MATESTSDNKQQWRNFVIPLAIILGFALLYYSLKNIRRRDQMRSGLAMNAQGRRALDRDIEAASARGRRHYGAPIAVYRYRHFPSTINPWAAPNTSTYAPNTTGPSTQGPQPAQRASTANRWAWVTNLNPRAARREEGLNELGEAPPPYEQQSASRKDEAGVSLGDMPSSRNGPDQHDGGDTAPVTAWGASNSPPAYGDNGVGRPPPAALRSSQRRG